MKALRHYFTFLVSLLITTAMVSCSDDDSYNDDGPTGPNPTGNAKTYTLNQVGNSNVSGTASFIEFDDNTVTIELDLQNTPAGGEHPAHIHFNTAAEGGGIAVSLTPVNGDTGESSTNFSTLDDGTAISFDQLLNFDGYINIHLSVTELSTIVAQGDIGQNELTGESVVYNLDETDVAGISGTAEFAKRANNTTLVRISLTGTPAGGSHPAHIHENDVATGGTVIVGLNPVDGDTGYSATQVTELVDGTAVSYDDLLTIDAYINVHLSDTELSTIVAQGNIGANDGTPNGGTTNFDVTNSGASAYIFNDSGFDNTSNPDLTLTRGETYTFTVNTPGHPFLIKSVQSTGTGNLFNDGVTNNGAVSETITFTVPSNAPDTLFYVCEFHGSMTGTITIID